MSLFILDVHSHTSDVIPSKNYFYHIRNSGQGWSWPYLTADEMTLPCLPTLSNCNSSDNEGSDWIRPTPSKEGIEQEADEYCCGKVGTKECLF